MIGSALINIIQNKKTDGRICPPPKSGLYILLSEETKNSYLESIVFFCHMYLASKFSLRSKYCFFFSFSVIKILLKAFTLKLNLQENCKNSKDNTPIPFTRVSSLQYFALFAFRSLLSPSYTLSSF